MAPACWDRSLLCSNLVRYLQLFIVKNMSSAFFPLTPQINHWNIKRTTCVSAPLIQVLCGFYHVYKLVFTVCSCWDNLPLFIWQTEVVTICQTNGQWNISQNACRLPKDMICGPVGDINRNLTMPCVDAHVGELP